MMHFFFLNTSYWRFLGDCSQALEWKHWLVGHSLTDTRAFFDLCVLILLLSMIPEAELSLKAIYSDRREKMTNTKEEMWCPWQHWGGSEGNITCQFMTSELQREWNRGMKEDLGNSALPPFSPVLPIISDTPPLCCRSGCRPWPSRLRKPGLLLALRSWHAHLELRWTHLSRRPGRWCCTSGVLAVWLRPEWDIMGFFFTRWTLWSSSWLRRLPVVAGRGPWRSQEPCELLS